MKSRKNDRSFDCVAFKRRAQAKIYDETRAMSPDEQVAYFRNRAQSGSLGRWWKAVSATPEALGVHESAARYLTRKKRR